MNKLLLVLIAISSTAHADLTCKPNHDISTTWTGKRVLEPRIEVRAENQSIDEYEYDSLSDMTVIRKACSAVVKKAKCEPTKLRLVIQNKRINSAGFGTNVVDRIEDGFVNSLDKSEHFSIEQCDATTARFAVKAMKKAEQKLRFDRQPKTESGMSFEPIHGYEKF